MIEDLKPNTKIKGFKALIVNATKGVTNAGQNYMSITLQDKSGQIEAKAWTVTEEDASLYIIGNIISIDGEVIDYKEKNQIKILSVSCVDQNFENLSDYTIESFISLEELQNRTHKIIDSIEDEELKAVVKDIYNEHTKDIFEYPAAVRNHHNFVRGLITHSLMMAELCDDVSKRYSNLNRSLLISGALLHDIGKIIEFTSPVLTKYSVEGKLIGHITLGYEMVKNTCEKLNINKEKELQLCHMILSHHGKLEFGSPVLPLTKEAFVLSEIDNLDSKLSAIDIVLKDVEEGDFAPRSFALDDRTIYNPKK